VDACRVKAVMTEQDFTLLQAYLDELHRGGTPARERIIADRPELAPLLECLDGLDGLALPPADDGATIPPAGAPPPDEQPPTIELPRPARRFGKYLLEAELGRGGMGVVYRARQIDLDRPVALKMILSSHLAAPDALERFQEESRAAAALTHPHIVAVYEAGQIDGQPFFAMQLVDGCHLGERARQGSIRPDEAAQLVADVARAVHHLHGHGIVHRDLKPSNILMDATGHPYVTDFGLVKVLGGSHRTTTGAIVGTPSYMSPEQASGRKDLGPASDVYSLGAILYELLTGRPPFREDSPLDTLVQVLESEPTAPRRIRPDVPPELELICLRCLEKAPADRFASADELAAALDAFLKGEETGLSLPGLHYRLRHWARREPALASRLIMLPVCMLIAQANYLLAGGMPLARHLEILGTLIGWGAASFGCQRMMNHKPWADATRFLWAAIDVILFSIIVLVADDINTPVVIGYPLIVAAAGLWFRVPLVWFTALVCVVSYLLLLVEWIHRNGETAGLHKHAIFVVGLVILAFMMSYQVYRVRALSRYYEHRRLP
jgi:eukaryotic-like serine/threonine-protein kinase